MASVLGVLAAIGFVVALLLRVVHRGPYVTGLDVIGAAGGLYRVSNFTSEWMLSFYLDHHYRLVWNTEGIFSSLIPGYLAWWWPSEHWPPVVTLATVLTALWLTARALDLRRDAWVLLLAWSASSTLLSFSVAGFAYISGILPYALALWTIFRWQRHWVATAVLCLLTIEVSWQVQEIGQTVFVAFFAAALLLPAIPWNTRIVWLLAGAWQWWLSLHHLNFNTVRFVGMTLPTSSDLWSRLGWLWSRIVHVEIDIPMLPLAAVTSVVLTRRHRWFWAALLVFHALLIALVAVNEGVLLGVTAVWSRRTMLLSFLCAAAAAAGYRERSRVAWLVVGLLVMGSTWQLTDTVRWAREPLNRRDDFDYTLPFVWSSLDYTVPFLSVRWYEEMRDRIEAGKKVLLVYNLSAYDENPANPACVLERLYLHFGHQRFVDSVLVFGSQRQRNIDLPIRPIDDLAPVLDGIDPAEVVGYRMENPNDAEPSEAADRFRHDMAAIVAEIIARFDIAVDGPVRQDAHRRRLTRFTLHRR